MMTQGDKDKDISEECLNISFERPGTQNIMVNSAHIWPACHQRQKMLLNILHRPLHRFESSFCCDANSLRLLSASWASKTNALIFISVLDFPFSNFGDFLAVFFLTVSLHFTSALSLSISNYLGVGSAK